jgi:hypothetical protein
VCETHQPSCRLRATGLPLPTHACRRRLLPVHERLILTHMLQTEVKSKMSALKKRLQKEPAFPNGSPAGRAIMGACQIATQAGYLRPRSVPTVMVRGD